jgi:hypothetical protein
MDTHQGNAGILLIDCGETEPRARMKFRQLLIRNIYGCFRRWETR